MIKQIDQTYIEECVSVIRNSFETVADEFNITKKMHRNMLPLQQTVEGWKHSLTKAD